MRKCYKLFVCCWCCCFFHYFLHQSHEMLIPCVPKFSFVHKILVNAPTAPVVTNKRWFIHTPSLFINVFRYLRATFCKYRKSRDSFEFFNFFIFCPNKPFSELFSKIQLKYPNALCFFQNQAKFENHHLGLLQAFKIK